MRAFVVTRSGRMAPRLLRDVLEPPRLASLQRHVRALLDEGGLRWEEWGRRHVRHNDPLIRTVHATLTPRVEAAVGRSLKPSYSFLACYGEGGRVPAHRDRAQCRYTLDLCLEEGGYGEPWPLFVDDQAYLFRTNEALLYLGCDQVHHRLEKPPDTTARLVFFHFVDADDTGPLD
jgi:hypothetical protein